MDDTRQPEMTVTDRRTLLGAAGVAAVAAGLAGCSSAQVDSVATQAVDAAASKGAEIVQKAIAAADVPVGGGKILADLGVVITQPTKGDYKAFSTICPHQRCPVSMIEAGVIVCTCHNSKFDIATGAVVGGPAPTGLTPKSVSVGADGITVN